MRYALRVSVLPPRVRETVADYRVRLGAALGAKVTRVVVFGSAARGEATEDSDIDVLVLLEQPTRSERRRALDIAGEIAMESGEPLSPVVLSVAEWDELLARERLLPREIERDGVEA